MNQERCYGCMRIKSAGAVCEHCGYDQRSMAASHHLPPGTVLQGKYLIGKALGQGGFGITYIGWDINLDIPVAIKEYYPSGMVTRENTLSNQVSVIQAGENPMFDENRSRFLREAQTLAKLEDVPEVVQVKNFFAENNTAYIIMGYVKGITLQQYIRKRGGHLTAEETFRILRPLMKALVRVHKIGLVHRDISPDNIMLQAGGRARLIDFGAAHEANYGTQVKSTQAVLKYGYAPIEQYQRKGHLGPWTDVYAMCATVYHCLTGVQPPHATDRMMGEEDFAWESIPGLQPHQIAALKRGTVLQYKDRTQSMGQLLQMLFPAVPETAVLPENGAARTVPLRQEPYTAPLSPELYTAPVSDDYTVPLTEKQTAGYASAKTEKSKKGRKGILPVIAVLIAAGVFAASRLGADKAPATQDTPTETQASIVSQQETLPPADPAEGEVYWLNDRIMADEVYQKLAALYNSEFGANVTVVTAASGTYGDTLEGMLESGKALTLFGISDTTNSQSIQDYCLDLSGTALDADFIPGYLKIYDREGRYCAMGYAPESCGILVNKRLLRQAGFDENYITDFDTLKEVAEYVHSHAGQLGFDAFVPVSMSAASSWRYTGLMINMDYYWEAEENPHLWRICPESLTGAYMDNYRALYDVIRTNSTFGMEDFEAEQTLFCLSGDWDWVTLYQKGFEPKDVGMIPYYGGVSGEENTVATLFRYGLAVNKNADPNDIRTTLHFLNWILTDDTAAQLAAEGLGIAPYNCGISISNPFLKDIYKQLQEGKKPMISFMSYQPNVDAYRAKAVEALEKYNQNPTDAAWEKVYRAFVNGWEEQYRMVHP